ncbi:MAG TPA: hypothetical protein VNM87_11210, partial [Candidatus Udaeobacter sp.]|nr:hypothetical protein [Candidatus Udaeobacter sp.]
MSHRRWRVVLVIVTLLGLGLVAPRPARAEEPGIDLGAQDDAGGLSSLWPGIQLGVHYRRWSVEQGGVTSTVDQLAVPIYALTSLRSNLDLSYLFTAASSEVAVEEGAESSLTGITDGKLGLTYYLPDPHWSVGLGLRVPTGESALDPEEETVAQALNDRIFGFPVRRYGEGTDLELRTAYATSWRSGVRAAAGIAYLIKGSFPILSPADSNEVRDDESRYEPGNELSLTGRVRFLALDGDWTAQARLAMFSQDQRDGSPELDEGTELDLGLLFSQEYLAGIGEVGVEWLLKGETEIASAAGVQPVRDVGGNILRLTGAFHGQLDTKSRIGGRTGLSWYGETDTGTGDGLVFELGPFYRRVLAERWSLDASYTFLLGSAEDSTIDLTGHDVSLAIA